MPFKAQRISGDNKFEDPREIFRRRGIVVPETVNEFIRKYCTVCTENSDHGLLNLKVEIKIPIEISFLVVWFAVFGDSGPRCRAWPDWENEFVKDIYHAFPRFVKLIE